MPYQGPMRREARLPAASHTPPLGASMGTEVLIGDARVRQHGRHPSPALPGLECGGHLRPDSVSFADCVRHRTQDSQPPAWSALGEAVREARPGPC